MAALTTERKTPKLGQDVLPSFPTNLGVDVAASTKIYAGALVCRDSSGNAVPGAATSTLVALGVAEKTVDNSAGVAGALTIVPRAGCFGFNNSSSGDAITKANVGSPCYIVDDNTVALTSNGGVRPLAGTIVAVDSGTPPYGQPAQVWVQVGIVSPAGQPTIQTGSTTLVAGTKTINTGITVTASSVIFVTRKTAGGTITSTIMYDAPSASRTVGGPGTGSIAVQASVAAGTANASDTSVVDYMIIG